MTTRAVTVTGVGRILVAQDRVVLRVAAVHRAPALADALDGAESARALLVQVARGHVEQRAVASESLEVWPAHDETGRPDGFEARHALSVRCDDLAAAGALLGALATDVGDRLRIEGVSLATGDTTDAAVLAREAAFADARAKAEHLAGLADAALGEVLGVSDGSSAPASVGHAGDARLRSAKAEVALEPGSAEVSAAVVVTWALR